MGKKTDKIVKRMRKDLSTFHPSSLVLVHQHELVAILDRLEKLEKLEKRKSADTPIKKGDRVEVYVDGLVKDHWRFLFKGAKGTVKEVLDADQPTALGRVIFVHFDNDEIEHRNLFMSLDEIRKVA